MNLTSRIHRVGSLAAMGVIALAAAIGLAAPAQAAPQDYCASGRACVWDDPSYNTNGNYGALHSFVAGDSDFSNNVYYGTSITAGDTADSWYNNGNTSTACFYDRANYNLNYGYRCLPKKHGYGNIANNAGLIQGVGWDPNSGRFV